MAKINLKGRRVFFPQGKQNGFINHILQTMPTQRIAKVCGVCPRTIRDWRHEKFSMSYTTLQKLSRAAGTKLPANIELKNRYWYVFKGSSAGGLAVYKKYGHVGGDPECRKKKWHEWWERKGKHRPASISNICKPILKPGYSQELAEFTGIILGDGGIAPYQVTITLHAKDDKKYADFVAALIKKLFEVPIAIYPRKKDAAINLVISRKKLVRFCIEKLGLEQGSKVKHQIDIPDWIKRNKEYSIACVRALVDTDGSVFTHRYKVKEKVYSYKKLSFTSHSSPLRQSVFEILRNLGLRVRLGSDYDVRIDSKKDMKKYFQIIGSHNLKHLKRYEN